MTLRDAAIIPLYHPLSAMAVQASVRGLTISPMGVGGLAMEAVWLADAPRPEAANVAALSPPRSALPAPSQVTPAAVQGRVP